MKWGLKKPGYFYPDLKYLCEINGEVFKKLFR